MFNKEHYEVIANAISGTYKYSINRFDAVGSHIAQRMVHDLVSLFMGYDSQFDRMKFMKLIMDKEEKKNEY